MEISENWLREWANPKIDRDTLLAQLTMAGLEVKGVRPAAPEISQVVVAEVLSVEAHPDADKLRVCQVNDGSEHWTVVCGAKNVRVNLKVAFAQLGASLPGIKIKKAKLRGVESKGMLCSASELQLAESSNGILELPDDAPVGADINDYLALKDSIIEIDLTPNRGDCLSILGVAREVAAINELPLIPHISSNVAKQCDDVFPVSLEASADCPRYAGRVIRNIDPQAKTPLWMQEKLRRCGLRPISPVVDVTNYVMMEMGQPMHGFDFDKLKGGIKVRFAEDGEELTLLDQSSVSCSRDTLVIADHDGPVALAGIMGGLDSSVQSDTTSIFLEAAHFNARLLAGKARHFGMHTDASHRFERGVDSQLPSMAVQRATELLLEITGGQAGPLIDQIAAEKLPKPPEVNLRFARIGRLLGVDVSKDQVSSILQRLEMNAKPQADGWCVVPPSYRHDISIEADLIEEVGRLIGYNNIPSTRGVAHSRMDSFSEQRVSLDLIRDLMVARGYFEAVTYSFVSPELQAILDPDQQTLSLANPISSDMSMMRTSLLPGLMQTLRHNLNRQQSRLRFFESGLCFTPEADGLVQSRRIAGAITGHRSVEGLYGKTELVDFFDIKGDLESVLQLAGSSKFSFGRTQNSILHPGQSADLIYQGDVIGVVGALHPITLQKLDIDQPVFAFEAELEPLLQSNLAEFKELSRFPSIRRDISVLVDEELPVKTMIDSIQLKKYPNLQEVFVFDVYTGKGVRNFRKSVALSLILQDFSRTLVEEDVEKLVSKVLKLLKQEYNAVLREN